MTPDAGVTGKAFGTRLAELVATLDRYDSFVFRPGPADSATAADSGPELEDAALALVRRALRTAGDPDGWRVLVRLRDGDATTAQLGALLGGSRLAVWEQVNELIQVGLVGRDLEGDRVGITVAGQGVVALAEQLAAAAAEAVQR